MWGEREGGGGKEDYSVNSAGLYLDNNERATVTFARVCICLPYTDLVNEMHLENWASIQDQRRNSNQFR